jgi:hypothetical protein
MEENKYINGMIELNSTALLADGFDDCIIGIAESFSGYVFVYSKEKMIEQLAQDMTVDEAYEYYEYNILGAYLGENMPIFLLNEDCYV